MNRLLSANSPHRNEFNFSWSNQQNLRWLITSAPNVKTSILIGNGFIFRDDLWAETDHLYVASSILTNCSRSRNRLMTPCLNQQNMTAESGTFRCFLIPNLMHMQNRLRQNGIKSRKLERVYHFKLLATTTTLWLSLTQTLVIEYPGSASSNFVKAKEGVTALLAKNVSSETNKSALLLLT